MKTIKKTTSILLCLAILVLALGLGGCRVTNKINEILNKEKSDGKTVKKVDEEETTQKTAKDRYFIVEDISVEIPKQEELTGYTTREVKEVTIDGKKYYFAVVSKQEFPDILDTLEFNLAFLDEQKRFIKWVISGDSGNLDNFFWWRVEDINNDNRLEIAIQLLISGSGGYMPFQIYQWDGAKNFKTLLNFTGAAEIKDLNKDNKDEIIFSYALESSGILAKTTTTWKDVYEWQDKEYKMANYRFPKIYQELINYYDKEILDKYEEICTSSVEAEEKICQKYKKITSCLKNKAEKGADTKEAKDCLNDKDYSFLREEDIDETIMKEIKKELPEGYKISKIIGTDIEKNNFSGYQNFLVSMQEVRGEIEKDPADDSLGFKVVIFKKLETEFEMIKSYEFGSIRGSFVNVLDINADGSKEMLIGMASQGSHDRIIINISSGNKFFVKGGSRDGRSLDYGFGGATLVRFILEDIDNDGIYEYIYGDTQDFRSIKPIYIWEVYKWDGENYLFNRKEEATEQEFRKKYDISDQGWL